MMKGLFRLILPVLVIAFLNHEVSAQCSSCSQTITLSSSSQTISYTVSGSGQTICIVKDPGLVGTATITSGTIDVNNQTGTVICFGSQVIVASAVNISNLNTPFGIINHGVLQNTLTLSQNQHTITNFGTLQGPVSLSNGTINNMSGGSFTSSGFTFNSGTFVNNSGSVFNIPGSFTAGSGSNFSGSGSFTVGGNFQTNNGATVNIGGTANIAGTTQTNSPVIFGAGFTAGNNVQSNNSGGITFNGPVSITGTLQSNAPISFASTSNITGNVSVNNGGPITFTGAATLGGTLQTNATTSFGSTLNLTGALSVNNGGPITVTGAATIGGNVQTNATTNFNSSVSIGGSLQVNNGGPLAVTGSANVTGSTQINATTSFGGLANLSGGLTMNNGGNTTFTGGATITGNYTNNAVASFNGTFTVSGTITNNSGGTITSGSGSCKTLCAASITNTGTLSSTSGPNMSVCTTPSGGTQTNVTINANPTTSVTGFTAPVTTGTVNGSFTHASPLPGGYLVLRKANSSFTGADLPVSNTTYTVGSTIGSSTVVAILNTSTNTFSNAPGCGTFYYAVVSASNNSGSCGTYFTTAYASVGPIVISTTTGISYTSPWCTSAGVQSVTRTGVAGGTYSSTAGLSINGSSGAITPSTSTPGTYTVSYAHGASGACGAGTVTASVTVNAVPAVTSMSAAVCSGASFSVTPVNGTNGTVPPGTTYSWSAPSVAGITGTASGTGAALISGTLTNTTNAPINVAYTVTPTAGTCVGGTFTVTVTVNPRPTMTSAASTNVCSGTALSLGLTSSSASTFSWVAADNTNTTGESTSAQTGATLNNTITNNVTTPQSVVYTVTPTGTAGSCVGTAQTVTVTVNPRPVMTSAASTSVCSGVALSFGLTSGATATYSWVATDNSNTTGESTSAQAGATLNNTITNTVTTPQNVVYTVTPTGTAGSCVGTAQTVTVTVNPRPSMTSASTTSVCSGTTLNFTLTSGAAATYSWVGADNTNTTGESTSAQTGATLNNTITNNVTTAQSVVYTVTPTGTAGSCVGTAQTVTVTVNPRPVMTNATTTSVCSGTALNFGLTSGAAATYSWVAADNTNTTGESTSAQTGATLNNTITNNTTVPQNVVYTVTPTGTAGSCVGTAQTVTVTVNPRPVMTSTSTASVCSGTALNIGLTSGAAATYSWIAANNTNTTGESTTAQSGATINNTITNNVTTPQSVVYTVTPTGTAGSCAGTAQTLTVTVNPRPNMTSASATSVCSGTALNFALTSGAAAIYSWIAADNTNTTGESTSAQSGATLNNTITNNETTPQNVVYTVTPTGTAGSCVGTDQTVTVTVNPRPVMTSAASTTICSGTALSFGLTSGASATYSWVAADNSNTTGESIAAQTGTTLNNTITNNTNTNQDVVYTITPTGTAGSCVGTAQIVTVAVNPRPTINPMSTAICTGDGFSLTPANTTNGIVPAGTTYSWSAPVVAGITGTASGSGENSISGTLVNTTLSAINVVYSVTPTAGTCTGTAFNVTVTVNPYPVVAAITGAPTTCVGLNTTFANATAGGVWSSTDPSIAIVNGSGLVTGMGIGTTNINYGVTVNGCLTTVSRSITVYPGPMGTPNTFGNGVWNAFVYNSTDYSTSYSGFYTTSAGLTYNSTTDFSASQAPSQASNYQGCQVSATGYSVRYQRTNFPIGVYQIGVNRNDDEMDILLNGAIIYSSGTNTAVRSNVWTGTLGANSNLEIRFRNTGGPGDVNWTFTLVPTPTASTGGTITGNQTACNNANPLFGLNSTVAPAQGTCTLVPNPIQWQSSTDNVTFSNIPAANGLNYTIPGILTQTTYYRRAYRTYCDTVYSNTVTVTIFNGPQGTPNTFGNGLWNAYVYNANDYSSNYSGFYTTGSALSYNSTTDFAAGVAPSLAASYQGCQMNANVYSIRYQRTNFPIGVYQIAVNRNDDEMDIILNGTTVYSSGTNTGLRSNVWTGTLGANSNLEIRYRNTGGPGDISWTFTLLPTPTSSTGGTVTGNQVACNNATPIFPLNSTAAPTQGSCTLVPNPIQWQISTNNITFTNIPAANAASYTIPGALSQTTYYRRAYRTYCDTVYSNTITVSVYNGPVGTPGVFGNGFWNAYVYNSMDYTTNHAGFFTTGSALNYNTTTSFGNTQAPSLAPTYQGCMINPVMYSIRFQRTNFTPGVYQIGFDINDDNADILLDGAVVYSSGGYNPNPRANVWTGYLGPNSNLEIRYLNNLGPGQISWNFTLISSITASNPGTISGTQSTCVGITPRFNLATVSAPVAGTCTAVTNPIQWQSSIDNVTFTNIAGANASSYTIPSVLAQTTYFRRAYRTHCDTVYSNTVTVSVYSGAQGTPGVFGNGFWNAYVYNSMDFSSNYSGFYTTGPDLNYNSVNDFGNTQAPSLPATYLGCQIGNTLYSVRYQRTGFPAGTYQIGVDINDDNMEIILNGSTVYSSGGYDPNPRTNVWTGTLGPNSNLEIRYLNNLGPGQISWNFTLLPSFTSSLPGSITGNQSVCLSATPGQVLTTTSAPTQGTCTPVTNPIQWQSSTDNLNFTNISNAHLASYTIPGPLAQTTYFRRAYRTFCDTVYTNTITVSVYNGAQGTPNTFGNGFWNAYVYNALDYSSNYSGFFTTGSALTYNTTTDYVANIAPSYAPTYQGCQVNPNAYSVRFQRTNFPFGVYQIGVNRNDDEVDIILNGVTVYSSGTNTGVRANVWTGTLGPNSNVEIRYRNVTGPGDVNWVFTLISSPTLSSGGTVAGNQSTCSSVTPLTGLTSVVAPVAGGCTTNPTPVQWQSSTNNVTFTNIPGATSNGYIIPGPLSQTTYFRRAHRTYCDTVYSNTLTVTVFNGAQGTPGISGNGLWNAYVYNATDYTSNYSGFYTTGSGLTYNSTSDFAAGVAPSLAPTYQGCNVNANSYSIRYQRTGFPLNVYQIGINRNDDEMDILVNGTIVYSSGVNTGIRANVWTGTLGANSNLEIRYRNTGGPGDISWTFSTVTNTPNSTPGTISGVQLACNFVLSSSVAPTQGNCTLVANPIQWQSSTNNVNFSDIPGANFGTYIVPGPLTQITYFRRAYRTFCDTVFSNVITVNLSLVNGAQGTPNVFGNGVWNAYVYNSTDYTSNYSGFYTTNSSLSQNSTTAFAANAAPSSATTYSGCPVGATSYSIRYQRTNFTPGVYQIGINRNDDGMDIILNGTTVYSSGASGTARTNVWTGTLNAGSQLEIRYRNASGNGDINWTITSIASPTASLPGTIAGNQTACVGATPLFTLSSPVAPTQGACTPVPNPIQWQSSINNVTFTNISGANAATYTIFGPLAQTTYFRRAYRTYCDTVFSNTVTVTVFNGAQGTPGTFGNGVWNAFVYNASDYSSNYSGFFTTGTGLSYNSTSDYAANQAPSLAPTYQGCHVSANVYSVRFQRTNFPQGVYQIGINRNDDGMNILLNGVQVYTSGGSGAVRPNVWTGSLGPNSNLEIQYQNLVVNGDISWTITPVTSPIASLGGTIAGNQAVCTGSTPTFGLTSVSLPTQGTCNLVPNPIQWQSSINNVNFTNIAGANSAAYTIPTALSQTTYFRRAYRTYCDTVYSNTVTVSVYNGAQGTPGVFGNGVWNAYVYNQSDYASGYSGYFTTSSSLSQNSTNDFATNASPSSAPTYQGCQVPALLYSVRYQRTNFTPGTYTIDVGPNDDFFAILLNGTSIYSTALNGSTRNNVWTGTLDASSQLEIRFNNTSVGPAYMSFNLTMVSNSVLPTGGAISGNQVACTTTVPSFSITSSAAGTGGTCTVLPTPYQWESSIDNVSFTPIAGATGLNYTIPTALSQTTYFRRAFRTYCETVYTNTVTVTVYNGAQGTPGVFGNGLWNAYVYNSMDYTNNYSGFYTTGSALNYNSTGDFVNNAAPSTTSTYQGCQIGSTMYSIRYQRTGFPAGIYQIGVDINDDNMEIILNGTTVYAWGGYNPNPRTNVWTGTLGPTSNLEIRYLNNMGPGQISWNFTLVPTPTASAGGTIAGNQSTCSNSTPVVGLTSVAAPTQGTCNLLPTPIQWQSSTNNVTFTNIAGANSLNYTIPSILSQTTYFRRAYRTWCDTVYSNTITVSIFNGAQGTPNAFGNGFWNAYVYNANDYTSNYSGFYNAGTALSYTSTTDFAGNQAPSVAPTYQGCQVSPNVYSVRYQRTNFPLGVYQIGLNRNDDEMDIILNGTTVYSTGISGAVRPNAWTGTLGANSNLEIRYRNTGGNGDISWTFTLLSTPTYSSAGTIAGNQVACNNANPSFGLTSPVNPSQGNCTQIPNAIQWQSSTNNVTFTNIPGANAATYTIPGVLSQTTYFRRAYRTYCDTLFSNTVTVTVYNGAQGTPNTFGNGLWNAYVYNANDYTSNYSGFYTTGSALTYNSTSDFTTAQAPSLAPTYQGCQVNANVYSVRYQRTNFPLGVYQIGVNRNDDEMDIILNGVTVYSSNTNTGVRTNVWIGTLGGNSNLEIRFRNTGGPGDINWTFTLLSTPTFSSAGSIAGNQTVCSNVTPTGITSSAVATQGTCTLVPLPYQWESSTDNVTFTPIAGANAIAYNFPGPVTQTTYYRRAFRTYCDTLYSNVVTKTVTTLPTATVSYAGSPFCSSLTTPQPVSITGTTGGTFSSTAGLSINPTTGGITPSASTAGSYTVTYTIAASGGCAAVSRTASVSITTLPSATISYTGAPFCSNNPAPQSVTRTGSAGGSYSSTAGLTIHPSTGAITPSSSTAGTYTVTYTIAAAAGCSAVTATNNVTINALPSASISYTGSPWCRSAGGSQTVSQTGTIGGSYSSTAGLSINGGNGTIDVGSSSTGSYTITYTIPASGGCPVVTTTASVGISSDVTLPTALTGTSPICQASAGSAVTTTVSNHSSLNWSVSGAGNSITGSGTSVTVNWDPAFSGTATVSVTANGCGGPVGPVTRTFVVHPTGQWLGISNNWNLAGNWCGGIPTITTDVVIPTGAVNMPQINGASFVRNLTLQPGTSLAVNGTNSLSIRGSFSNSGTFSPSATSTVSYDGAASQSIVPTNYGNLTTSGAGDKIFENGATTRIAGTFTPGAGTHLVDGSTVEFNGTSAQTIPAFTFHNLTTSGNNAKSLSGSVVVNNQLAITNGTFHLLSSALTLGGTITGSGTITGTCASSLNITGAGATGTLRFTSGSRVLGTLNMNKSASGNVVLGTPLDICGNLLLSTGKIILGSNDLTLLPGASTSNGNAGSYVQTLDQMSPSGAGFFIRSVPSGSGELVFPVGTVESYTPSFLDNIGFSRDFKVRVFNNVFEHGISGAFVLNLDYSVRKTWEIEPVGAGGNPDVTIRLQWNLGDEGMHFAQNRLNNKIYMGKNTGIGNSLWSKLVTDETQFSSSPFQITTARVTTFSKFAIGSDEAPLPVSMGRLEVKKVALNQRLTWKTYSERETKGFEILKSEDGNAFRAVGFVPATGESDQERHYHFDDRTSVRKVFYKIRSVGEKEGDVQYSNTVVALPEGMKEVAVYPNPVSSELTVEFHGLTEGSQPELRVLDVHGKTMDVSIRIRNGKAGIDFSALPSGIYWMEMLENGTEVLRRKIVKQP